VLPLHLVRLARFCDWTIATEATATPHTFTLAPERIAQLAAWGTGPAEVLEQLTAALGRRPSRRAVQRLRAWAHPGQQMRLRPLLVLEAENGELLAQVRRHKLVRKRLGEVVAPNRIALDPADAAALAQTLRTLGYYVEPPSTSSGTASTPSTGSGAEAAGEGGGDRPVPEPVEGTGLSPALQWFLITVYQRLGHHLPLPLDLPWDVRQALRGQLSALQQASAESAASRLLDSLQAALTGYLQLPAWSMPATEAPEPVIQQALDQGHDIEIRYWGPADGHVTNRMVTPYWIEERDQSRYLIGWCHLRQQERTFRLDRIEAVEVRVRAGRQGLP